MAWAVAFLIGAWAQAAPAEWPMYRHDAWLTARSEGVGGLERPQLSWSHDLRGWEALVEVRRAEGETEAALALPAQPAELGAEERASWGLAAPRVDLAGDGTLAPSPPYAADILTDRPGLEWPDTVMEDNERGWCVLYGMENGQRKELWRSEQFRVYQGPHPIVGDANADGQLDVIACPHYQMVVMDGRTGQTIQQLRWHDGRNYGHFVGKNIDDDPALEFLVLADFYTHIDLIDNDGAELRLLWRKEIELRIAAKDKILRPRWDSLQDLDGDGRFEVIANLYNDAGDGRWHLMVWEALTGETVADLPGTFLTGLEDVDRDGRVELFCCEAPALFEPTSARLSILNLVDGRTRERAAIPDGAWVTMPNRYPLNINSLVAHAERNVVTVDQEDGRRGVVWVRAEGDGCALECRTLAPDDELQLQWKLGLAVAPSAVRAAGRQEEGLLIGVQVGHDIAARLAACQARPLAWSRTRPERARWGNLIAADLDGDERVSVVTTTANREVAALGFRDGEPTERWRHRGAGTLAAGDFDGDGAKEAAMLGWEPSGEGNVTVIDGSGERQWRAPIAGFPGPLEPWNFGTLTTLAVGRLGGATHDDMLVFARRSTMHSDEGHALNGRDGSPLWRRPTVSDGAQEGGFGGVPVALYDVDGDGGADAINLYPVNLSVVSGRDGAQLVGRSAAGDSIFPGIWAAYSEPTLFDYTGDGAPELTWNGQYCLGMTNLQGDTLWAKTPPATGFPCDADGDGRWEMASAQGTTLRWLDPTTGDERWTLPLPGTAGAFAIADVDGDGAEETLVACGQRLVAASAPEGRPRVLWELEAPAGIEEFILADTNADDRLEAVLQCADGVLRGVKG
ncbi:MAG: hypothetical protein FJX74_16060 [Armatimonadetes bacterium]|nr:hypothetical protein [Armatimonadota bacterium]